MFARFFQMQSLIQSGTNLLATARPLRNRAVGDQLRHRSTTKLILLAIANQGKITNFPFDIGSQYPSRWHN
jgi:hypothetical protein